MRLKNLLQQWKFEFLLFALVQHLFIGIFLRDLHFYSLVIWPINMLLLGFGSIGIFIEKEKWKNIVRNILFLIVLLLPIGLPFFKTVPGYFLYLCLFYFLFFLFIFWEIIKFLLRPSYINVDIISASACGYLLLIELCTFLMQFFFYQNPASFKGINTFNPTSVYTDLVYFSSITLTSIGFGDITPAMHYTKLFTSIFGIAGQFYSVVLVGILISKFVSKTEN